MQDKLIHSSRKKKLINNFAEHKNKSVAKRKKSPQTSETKGAQMAQPSKVPESVAACRQPQQSRQDLALPEGSNCVHVPVHKALCHQHRLTGRPTQVALPPPGTAV